MLAEFKRRTTLLERHGTDASSRNAEAPGAKPVADSAGGHRRARGRA
jgi:hypothetical protein